MLTATKLKDLGRQGLVFTLEALERLFKNHPTMTIAAE
jgi:hypothetical protein